MNSVSQHGARLVLVTGATGFIGSVLLRRLLEEGGHAVSCLVRVPGKPGKDGLISAGARMVEGDLLNPASLEAALAGVDTVIHMAAATGSASPEQLAAVNVRGTASLLAACKRQQVERIIYLSSIAATYPDLRDYPYGESKRQAESLVRESGMRFAIVRPTIVLGPASSNWSMLRALASLPIVPLIGGGSARVQPVDVEVVASALVAILNRPDLGDVTIDVGGPEVLDFAEFLQRVRRATGRKGFPRLPVPVWPIRWLLRVAAALAGNRLPVGPGQLVPFTADGVASQHPLAGELRNSAAPLDELLIRLCAANGNWPASEAVLRRECEVFCRYLIRQPPDDYVIRKYLAGDTAVQKSSTKPLPIDASLVAFASRGPRHTRIADAYARFFRPYGSLRHKLLLMFAILENSRGYSHFTLGANSPLPGSLARVAFSVGMFCMHMTAGILMFGPRQLIAGQRTKS